MRVVSLLFHDVYDRTPAESGFVSAAADRYKLATGDFDAQLAGAARVRQDAPLLAAALIAPATRTGSPFTVTVDDGGVSYHTQIADRLEARGWRGHCFVSTDYIGQPGFLSAAQIRELDARGHVIGSHTASHPFRLSARGIDEMRREWSDSRAALEDVLGHEVPIASVPGGYFSRTVAEAADDAGIRVLFTSEPVTSIDHQGRCTILGRFALRAGAPSDTCARLVMNAPWARYSEWASWNAKGLLKPLLGASYGRVADWLCARKAFRV